MTPHVLTISPHATTQIPTSSSNKIVDIVGDTRPIIGEVQSKRLKRSPLSYSIVQITRSRRKKKDKEPVVNQIVVDLDLGEETEVMMEQQVLSNTPMQDMDAGKELEEEPNPMSTMTIVNPPDAQTPPLPKETSYTSRWLEASIGKKHNIVPITILMEEMVSKFLGKISKPMKVKVEEMMEVNDEIGHWIVEVAKRISDRDPKKATEDDFTMRKLIREFLQGCRC